MAVPGNPCSVWRPAYVGLGSNLGDSRRMLERAVDGIAGLARTRLIAVSPLYRSLPFGPVEQGDFLNAVAAVITTLEPRELLQALRSLELDLGRQPSKLRWGPREIDLDLLVHGDACIDEDDLTLPHPGIPERDFVLYPLRDVAAALQVPGVGTVAELAAQVADRGMTRID